MKDIIISKLLELGFSEKNAQIIETLNRIGPTPAATLSRLCEIKRASIYDYLNSLIQQNLIIQIKKGSTAYFAITDLNKIYQNQQEKLLIAKNTINLLDQNKSRDTTVNISYFVGIDGIKSIFKEIIKDSPKEIYAWLDYEEFTSFFGKEIIEQWTINRAKNKIYAKILFKKSNETVKIIKNNEDFYRESRFINANFSFETSMIIYKNTIFFFDTSKDSVAVKMNNSKFAKLQIEIFNLVWNFSK